MRRRSKADGKAVKTRRRKAVAPKRRNAPKTPRNSPSSASQGTEVARLSRELTEALEQQSATADVLRMISSSPSDIQPVLDAIVRTAGELCAAEYSMLFRLQEGKYHVACSNKAETEFVKFTSEHPISVDRGSLVGRTALARCAVHIEDCLTDPEYTLHEAARIGRHRTMLGVPLLREGVPIGVIGLLRTTVKPFTRKQIELVTTFADQAVIAIENTRLLNDLRQRTDDLTEALGQQTATSEVLRVISSSPGELQAVFAAILNNAVRICTAQNATLWLVEDDRFRSVARYAEIRDVARDQIQPGPKSGLGRVRATKQIVHITDYATEPAYHEGDPFVVRVVERLGIRTNLSVPMLKENELVGAISIYRTVVRPFSDKQIKLIVSFASQAVIAIENVRLLKELRERTSQLEVQSQEVGKLNQQLEQRVADQVGQIERMGRLRRFLPPQVADLIVASGTEKQLESHRREITALFCDLRGFTGFSETSDPEDVMALLRDYHAAIGETIIKYSGTLERYAGDGVMVVFNDPVPVEKPALQAVLMALEMRDVIGALTEKWRRLGHDIGFGIGIAHGFATLGTIGFEGRFDYAAIGTVSNVASRLCDEAKPGQILISPRVLMAVEHHVTVEPVGEFALKGIRRPILAHNVIDAASSP